MKMGLARYDAEAAGRPHPHSVAPQDELLGLLNAVKVLHYSVTVLLVSPRPPGQTHLSTCLSTFSLSPPSLCVCFRGGASVYLELFFVTLHKFVNILVF